MGCDIHPYVEILRDRDSSAWRNYDNWRMSIYESDAGRMGVYPIYNRRNYALFSVLAGVRDYSDSGITPISSPRGLPKDVSATVKKLCDECGSDGHSHSWLTLKEIRDYYKSNPTVKRAGLISIEASAKLGAGILPQEYCQGTTRKDVVRREWEEPDNTLSKLITALEGRAAGCFLVYDGNISNEMAARIRLVFWFDN